MLTAAAGTIRLRDHPAHLMPGREECLQGRNSEVGCTKKEETEGVYHLPVRVSLLIFRTMRSF